MFPRQLEGVLQTSLGPKLSTHLPLLRVLSVSLLSTSSAVTIPSQWKSLSSKLRSCKFHSLHHWMSMMKGQGTTPVFACPSGSSPMYGEAEALEFLLQMVARCPECIADWLPSFWSAREIVIPPTDITWTLFLVKYFHQLYYAEGELMAPSLPWVNSQPILYELDTEEQHV